MKKRSWNPLKNLYNQNGVADKKLRKDLNLFTYAVALGSVFFSVSSGTPFTGFARALGTDDLQFSILMAVPVATSFLQFFASWLMERTRKRKAMFVIAGIIQRSLWIPVALVPLLMPMDRPVLRLWVVIGLISVSSVAGMFMNVTFYSWLGDLVPMHIRGRYLGLRQSVQTATGLISALLASFVLDLMPGLTGYAIVFGIVSLFGVADIAMFIWIGDPPMQQAEHEPLLKSLSGVLKNKGFLLYLLFWTAWAFAWNLPGPFYNKYNMDQLGLSLSVTTLTGQVAYGVMAVLFVQWWGRKLDKHGHHWVLLRCGLVLCALPLVWIFATPGSFWPMLIFSLSIGVFFSGVDLTSVQMLVTVTPQRNRSMYVAMYMVITSMVGVSLANLTAGKLLNMMGDLTFQLFGIQFDRYKLLFAGACVLRLFIVLLLLPAIAHLKQHENENAKSNIKEVESNEVKELA